MAKKKPKKESRLSLPEETKKLIWGVLMFLIAIIISLSFFDLAGPAGQALMGLLDFLIGKVLFVIPLILILVGLAFFSKRYKEDVDSAKAKKEIFGSIILAFLLLVLGISGMLECLNVNGGWVGFLISWPFINFFGLLVSRIIFSTSIIIGCFAFWHVISPGFKKKEEAVVSEDEPFTERLAKKVVEMPKFNIKEITSSDKPKKEAEPALTYDFLPVDLLDKGKEKPTASDIKSNSAIIQKTLANFDIPVEVTEVNIGPTVTQYSLKPAEGVKLSKITGLINNLSLALAAHPIRIEAPIPGKSLVGIEIPNSIRAKVIIRELIADPGFRASSSSLTFVLGKDVSGAPLYADLGKMPHLLVAGATGSGKTIFLNSLILSLLYRGGPDILRLILIDPKRVEFSAYANLPHLLAPVIFDAQKTVNVLQWLTSEMESRFDTLSEKKTRNITDYNEKVLIEGGKPMPFIVLIIDELADLMLARGKEIELGIVRLAQMARAVGIHLVVATQRPSVEVVTGLIKANITSRVAFQVASQVDSRTVLDMAGAEKLLGRGDTLFVSSDSGKPKRIQGSYVSDKEIRRVTHYIVSKTEKQEEDPLREKLIEGLEKPQEGARGQSEDFWEEDPLYEEAKKVIIETGKASASLLQRRLRLGYARAARIIDMLEERGVVGPSDGAKPREVYGSLEDEYRPVGEMTEEQIDDNIDNDG